MPIAIRYIGNSSTGIRVPHPDPDMPGATTVTVCPPGETVELPDDIAVFLVDAGIVEPADRKAANAVNRHRKTAGQPDQPDPDADPPAPDDDHTEHGEET